MQIRIHTAKNGFIVYPLVDEAASLSRAPVDYTMNNDEVMVFETFKSLVECLQKMFNPIIVVDESVRGEIRKTP